MNSWSNSLQTGKTAYKPGEQFNTAEQVTSPALFAAYRQESLATSMYGCIHTSVGHLHVDGIARTLLGPSSEDLEVLFIDVTESSWQQLNGPSSSPCFILAVHVKVIDESDHWPCDTKPPSACLGLILTAYACLLICFLTLCNANNAVCWPAHNPLYGLHTGQGVGISL